MPMILDPSGANEVLNNLGQRLAWKVLVPRESVQWHVARGFRRNDQTSRRDADVIKILVAHGTSFAARKAKIFPGRDPGAWDHRGWEIREDWIRTLCGSGAPRVPWRAARIDG
jgi:hypothetical protein